MVATVYCYFFNKKNFSILEKSSVYSLHWEEFFQHAKGFSYKRKKEYVLSRILLKFALSLHLPNGVREDIKIQEQVGGSPLVALAENYGLAFNISHSHELIGVAVTSNNSVGLDMEYLLKQRSYRFGIKYFCNESQQAKVLNAGSEQLMAQYYYQFWTQKEAFIKYMKWGIRETSMREIVFTPSVDAIYNSHQVNVIGGIFRQYQIAVVACQIDSLMCFEVVADSNGQLSQWFVGNELSDLFTAVLNESS